MKILVVDDEQLLVKGIKFNLENEGYQVLTAYDGAAAVELARREPLDLIILDLMMPQLSGSEACMKIREFSDVPIIMLTARSEDADKLMGFACGADDGQGIRSHRAADEKSPAGIQPGKPDEPGVGLFLRRGLPHGGRTHPPSAGKAGENTGGAGVHHDKVGSWLLFCGGKPAYSLSSA